VTAPTGPRTEVDVLVVRLDADLPLPSYAHPGDAGLDLLAAADVDVAPAQRVLVPTGVAIALPDGYAAFIHPRSGLAIREGLTVANAPGTVDAGYRGEVKVALVNLDPESTVSVRRGDRIAQLVVQRVEYVRFHEVERLPGSARAAGGFGSTGRGAQVEPDRVESEQTSTASGGRPDVALS
jgi:dUTP pyrophosphatase